MEYLDVNTTDDLRWALATGVITSSITEDPKSSYTWKSHTVTVHTPLPAAVICKFDYSISRANVTHDLESDSFSVGTLTNPRHLEDLTGIMLGEILDTALREASNVNRNSSFSDGASSLFAVLLQNLDGDQSLQRLMSPEILQEAATLSYSGMATYFMQHSYLTASNVKSNARVVYAKERLRIGLASMSIVATGFVLLILCTVCIMLTTPSLPVPRDIDSLAVQAMILRSSSGLQDILRAVGRSRTSRLTALLSRMHFAILPYGGFEIKATLAESAREMQSHETKHNAWIPPTVRYPMAGITFLVPLVTMIVLEVLNRISLAERGIVDVSGDEDVAAIVSRYVTALVMLLIATSFNGFDFVVSSFAPFSNLRRGAVPPAQSVHFHLLGSMPSVAIMRSLKARDYASVFSNVAAMTGTVLTVIASGLLFVDRAVMLDLPVLATFASRWNISWDNSSQTGDGGAVALLDQVQHGMAAMPATIWNGTVLSVVEEIPTVVGTNAQSQPMGNYTLVVNALRPELECEIVPEDRITMDMVEMGLGIFATPVLPPGCQHGGQYGTDGFINYSQAFSEDLGSNWKGVFLDLHVGPWPEFFWSESAGDSVGGTDFSNLTDNPAGCPSIGIIFVKGIGLEPTPQDVTALLCSQKLELVSVSLHYHANDSSGLLIDTHTPPVLLPGPATYLTNGTHGIDTFTWRVQTYLSRSAGQNFTRFSEERSVGTLAENDIDVFFNHIVWGPNGTAPEHLAGPENQANLIRAVQTLYNKYMYLVIDMKFREPINRNGSTSDNNNDMVHGMMQIQRSRLKVNAASKLALQIMLGVMTALGLGAWCLTNLRGTLPRNPCSIASTMALLAGSDLCDGPDPLIPGNALLLSKREQHELFSGWMFSLGWWRRPKKSSSSSDAPATDEVEPSETLLAKEESEEWKFGIDVGMPERLGFRERTWIRRKGRKPVEAE